jgi:hypothetical protein
MKVELVPEVGDVVYLNSDFDRSTPMTIESINDSCECCDERIVSVVYADYGDIKRDEFDIKMLSYEELG